MGEAKRKGNQFALWRDNLSAEEKVILSVAQATYARFVVPSNATGMCYRLAIFLSTYLQQRHYIQAPAIVGYVNDGLGDVMVSHAWIEYNNKKTDISLTISEHPDHIPTGPIIILDQQFSAGDVQYTYHYGQTQAGLQAEIELLQDNSYSAQIVAQKRNEHAMMQLIVKDYDSQRAYLDRAPDGINYARMVAIIES